MPECTDEIRKKNEECVTLTEFYEVRRGMEKVYKYNKDIAASPNNQGDQEIEYLNFSSVLAWTAYNFSPGYCS